MARKSPTKDNVLSYDCHCIETTPPQPADRSSVIMAPSRLAATTASNSAVNSHSSATNSSQNNYFRNSFQQNSSPFVADSRLSTTTNSKTLLRPSVLRVADSSTNVTVNSNEAQNPPKDGKVFTFVSLSKDDITRPATTLLQSDSIIRCGADTTSPFNGEEAPGSGSAPSFSAVSSTSTTTPGDGNGVGSEADDSNSQSSFVFGQNLEDRAVVKHKNTDRHESSEPNCTKKMRISTSDESTPVSEAVTAENGSQSSDTTATTSTSETVVKPNTDGVLDLSSTASSDSSPDKNTSREEKRKYEVITGEEDEQNVLSMHCRLYAWETDTSTWKERGRGTLRLNDAIKDDKLCSRIVMRTSGALRVILNAHLVSGMRFDLSNEQCLRFINVDGIYLIKGATKDIDQLYSAIEYRLREISKRHKTSEDDSNDGSQLLSSTSRSPPKSSLPHQKASIEDNLSNDS